MKTDAKVSALLHQEEKYCQLHCPWGTSPLSDKPDLKPWISSAQHGVCESYLYSCKQQQLIFIVVCFIVHPPSIPLMGQLVASSWGSDEQCHSKSPNLHLLVHICVSLSGVDLEMELLDQMGMVFL